MISDTTLPSGRFVLRLDPRLHARLRDAAAAAGVSLNEYCARTLESPAGPMVEPARQVVERGVSVVGEGLIGVVAFGSWARDELASGSDVDLLLVVDDGVRVERSLYDAWDVEPARWDSRAVEPHFVRLPDAGARVSGLWAEAAVDGVVLLDRDLWIARYLVSVRRRIAEGELVRRRSHGQSYWVEAA